MRTTTTVEELEQEYAAARERLQSLHATTSTPPTPAEAALLDPAIARVKALRQQLDRAREADATSATFDRVTRLERHGGISAFAQQLTKTAFGQYLTAHRGRLVRSGPSWTTPPLDLIGFGGGGDGLMALSSDPASGGALVLPDVQPGILPAPTRRLVVADLFSQGTTASNSVTFMREKSIDNQAAAVAEGAVKPQSAITFEAANEPVRKIATWLEVTEEIIEDVDGLAAYLNTRLRHFVLLEEEEQLLTGNGVAPNFAGVLTRPGLAPSIARVDPENNSDVLLRQISAIEIATEMPVDSIVMSPDNWNAVLLLKDDNGNYLAGGGPFGNGLPKTLWGRAVAVTPKMPAGTGLVGAFKTGATFRRRTPVRVQASNSHADFFIKNLIALVAEERGALVIYREGAFGTVTNLTTATPV